MFWYEYTHRRFVNLERIALIQCADRIITDDRVMYQIRFCFSTNINDYVAREWEDENARNGAYSDLMRHLVQGNKIDKIAETMDEIEEANQ
jgi:hypothetical protein